MGKTKDVTTEPKKEVHGTIFDDVFRTIAQKMPALLIPLINEVFQTNYPEDIHFQVSDRKPEGRNILPSMVRLYNLPYKLRHLFSFILFVYR